MGARPKEDSVGADQLLGLVDEVGKSCGEGIAMLASVVSSGYKRPPLARKSAKAAMIAKFELGSASEGGCNNPFSGLRQSAGAKNAHAEAIFYYHFTIVVISFVALHIRIQCLDLE